jgi:hypothetical protein
MTVNILENFISEVDAKFIIQHFSKNLSAVKDRPGFFEDFYVRVPTPLDPQKLDENNVFKTFEESKASAMINNVMYLAGLEIGKRYGVKIIKTVGGMTKLSKGAFHGVHADLENTDGTPIEDDLDAKSLNYSGLLYLSKYQRDFSGGILNLEKLKSAANL